VGLHKLRSSLVGANGSRSIFSGVSRAQLRHAPPETLTEEQRGYFDRGSSFQKLTLIASWNARGPPDPNTCVARLVGWPNAALVKSPL
jgi:hypothetical protein